MTKTLVLTLFVLTLFMTAFGLSSFASQTAKPVLLDMKLELDGQTISQPHATIVPGKTGIVTQKLEGQDVSYSVQIKPIMKSANSVELDFVISRAIGSQTRVLSKPRVIARNNSTASLEQRSKDEPTLKLTVTPSF